jgi:hypothetical protein
MTESQKLVTRFQSIFGDSIRQAALFFNCSQATLVKLRNGESAFETPELAYYAIAITAFEDYQSKDGALQLKKSLKRKCNKRRIHNFRGSITQRDPITNRFVRK